MKILSTKILLLLIEYTYLNLISVASLNLTNDCIFGVESVSTILYNSEFPYGKHMELQKAYNIDPSKRVAFFIHGFISSANNSNGYNLIQQLRLKKDYTIVSVDWSQGACKNGIPLLKLLEYPFAVDNTRTVGSFVAAYVINLMIKGKVPLQNIMCIGHSLGAHICGFAAKRMQVEYSITMQRIIGADPAAPLFASQNCSNRLCITDTEYLCALHTSSLGIPYPIGHSDFFFNNATMQPGCGINISCSHDRAMDYQTFMLQYDCGFPGVTKTSFSNKSDSETTNCIFLDSRIYDENYTETGEYDVFVNSEYPYCVNNTLSNSCNKN